jgi:hypothetical protein
VIIRGKLPKFRILATWVTVFGYACCSILILFEFITVNSISVSVHKFLLFPFTPFSWIQIFVLRHRHPCFPPLDKGSNNASCTSINSTFATCFPQNTGQSYMPIWYAGILTGRSQWQRGLRHELSSPARTFVSWVPIPLEACVCARLFCVCVVWGVGSGLATGWSPPKESHRLCIGFTYLLMELSLSGGAANSAATQEFPSILWNPKVHYRHYYCFSGLRPSSGIL